MAVLYKVAISLSSACTSVSVTVSKRNKEFCGEALGGGGAAVVAGGAPGGGVGGGTPGNGGGGRRGGDDKEEADTGGEELSLTVPTAKR